jgi:hypothetical protein
MRTERSSSTSSANSSLISTPQGYAEIHLTRMIGLDFWRLNRIKAVEENIFAYGQVLPDKHFTHELPKVEHAIGHAHTYMRFAHCIDKISLYESRLSRNIARNLDLLMKLQARRGHCRLSGFRTTSSAGSVPRVNQ